MDSNPLLHWSGVLKLIPPKKLLLTLFYGVARIGLSSAWPYLLYRFLKQSGQISTQTMALGIGTAVLLFVLSAIVSFKQSAINIDILHDFSLKLVEKVWRKMNALDWLTFHGKSRVYYFDMLMTETWRLRTGLGALLETLIVNSVTAAILTLFLVFISGPLFMLCMAGLAITAIFQLYGLVKIRPYMKHFHQAWRDQHHWIAKSVEQFDLIKLKRGYREALATNTRHSQTFLTSNGNLLNSQAKWRAINQMAGNMVRIAILIIGIYWVQIHVVQLNELLLVFLIVSMIQGNLLQAPGALTSFLESREAMNSITDFFALKEEQQKKTDRVDPINAITIRDLNFRYDDQSALVQTHIDLKKGNIYLWKGRNGTGKSTTAHVLLGLLVPQSGSLLINGRSIAWDQLHQWRNRFAFLNQHSPVFRGTVRENTVFGHDQPDDAWNFLTNNWLGGLLPSGKDVGERLIGERGEGLSGGEAKRIALIRELVRNPELIILDEPLNHLDEYAIQEIKKEIIVLKQNAIIIIISHQTGFEDIADEIKEF